MHELEVAEVIRFAESGPLLAGGFRDDIELLGSFEEALSRAVRQPELNSPWVDWTDLREQMASELNAVKYELHERERSQIGAVLSQLASDLSTIVRRRLRVRGFERAHNEVSTDLWKVATSRILQGRRHRFWEEVFALYLEGLWPCGWIGMGYPDHGRFIAFAPPMETDRTP